MSTSSLKLACGLEKKMVHVTYVVHSCRRALFDPDPTWRGLDQPVQYAPAAMRAPAPSTPARPHCLLPVSSVALAIVSATKLQSTTLAPRTRKFMPPSAWVIRNAMSVFPAITTVKSVRVPIRGASVLIAVSWLRSWLNSLTTLIAGREFRPR